MNEPEATSSAVNASGCRWHVSGVVQCSRSTPHDNAEAGRVPEPLTVAEPENGADAPTTTVAPAAGCAMVGTGAAVPALIVQMHPRVASAKNRARRWVSG